MFPEAEAAVMSNSTYLWEEPRLQNLTASLNQVVSSILPPPHQHQLPQKIKKKRNLPGNPDPDAEVIALSPKSLLATNKFVCEICKKGFQRDQNLQLHRRGHNLPWKLKQRNNKESRRKRAYVCPEPSCVHHNPSRALGDLTGIKKHYCRKHGEKKWKCDKCSKIYAVHSDWKAHSKTCGTREYRCDCGTLFSRKDSFITHRAFCDALAQESSTMRKKQLHFQHQVGVPNPLLFRSRSQSQSLFIPWQGENPNPSTFGFDIDMMASNSATSATALLQKAATMGASSGPTATTVVGPHIHYSSMGHVTHQSEPNMAQFGPVNLTRDFLGVTVTPNLNGAVNVPTDTDTNNMHILTFTDALPLHYLPYPQHFLGLGDS